MAEPDELALDLVLLSEVAPPTITPRSIFTTGWDQGVLGLVATRRSHRVGKQRHMRGEPLPVANRGGHRQHLPLVPPVWGRWRYLL